MRSGGLPDDRRRTRYAVPPTVGWAREAVSRPLKVSAPDPRLPHPLPSYCSCRGSRLQ